MDTITLLKIDDVHMKVMCEPSVKMELSEYFTFQVPGYKFTPAYKQGRWDGKIKLLNLLTGRIYGGLIEHIKEFADARGYRMDIDPDLIPADDIPEDVGYGLAELFKTKYKPRYYQAEAVYHSLKYKRAILLSATSSGKSFIIYLICRYLHRIGKKVLIVVPTTSLVRQMTGDFIDYNNDEAPFKIHQIEGGVDKNVDADVVISTWQSIYKLDKSWFDKFEAIIGDECHSFKAKSLIEIMEKATECEYKLGFTGTLDGEHCNELVLQGLFGKAVRIVDAATLIADGTLAAFKIKALVMDHGPVARKVMKKKDYKEEMDFLVHHPGRNRFIRNLAWNVKGNTLILYEYVEKHGKVLAEMLQKEGKMVLFVSGQDKTDYREEVRKLTELNNNVIVIASYGVFRQGINIVNLDNLIFASPTKSKIRFLQSIGRVLRRGINNTKAILYDIADDLSSSDYINHTLRHFRERIETYAEESFDYTINTIELKDEDLIP